MTTRLDAKYGLITLMSVASLTGCSSLGTAFEPNRIDYRSASKAPTASLEVPPDLTQIRRDNRFSVPEANQSSATASSYNQQKNTKAVVVGAAEPVALSSLNDMQIVREGGHRYLRIKQAPESVWPQIKEFWLESGFLINIENAQSGIMETDWAENRAKIPQDIIRNTLGKVFDSLYSTGERDKFRTRLERTAQGETEVFISHRGAQEVLTGQKDSTMWTTRANDPELEAEFLSRLMARLGADPQAARQAVATAAVAPAVSTVHHASLLKTGDARYLEVDEGFDRTWRRVGLALDRIGFTVEDRDRSQGLYYVRYIDQDADAKNKKSDGFFSKLFTWGGSDDKKDAQRFRIYVKSLEGGKNSQVTVHGDDGKVSTSPAADKILQLLAEQMK